MAVQLALLLAALIGAGEGNSQDLGTDLSGFALCFYGDCEARGSYAADPLGWTNPATLPVRVLGEMPRGAIASGTYYRVNVGTVGADIGAGILTAAFDPWMFQAIGIYGEGTGGLAGVPGARVRFINRTGGLAAAIDLGRTRWKIDGLCLGALVAIPGLDNDLDVSLGGTTVVSARERRGVDITGGFHWRYGRAEWLMLGGFVDGIGNDLSQTSIDPATGAAISSSGTSNTWLGRFGLSMLPFVPLINRDPSTALAAWATTIRLGADAAYANISIPGEQHRQRAIGYFGVDIPLIPDALPQVSQYMKVVAISGIDTTGGWGAGLGLYGAGPLAFLSCNPGYSSRPLLPSLGHRTDVWAATCTAVVPF